MEENRFRIVGIIEKKFPIKDVSASFRKQEFLVVIEDFDYKGEPKEEYVKFQCVQNIITTLAGVNEGDKVTIEYKLTGRIWENKEKGTTMYFTNLDVIDIGLIDSATGRSTLGDVIRPGEVLSMDGGSNDILGGTSTNADAVDDELFGKQVLPETDEPEDCNQSIEDDGLPF